jgi:hypothetical protein
MHQSAVYLDSEESVLAGVSPNLTTVFVIAAYLGSLAVFRLCVAVFSSPQPAFVGESWLHKNFARAVPSLTFLTMALPLLRPVLTRIFGAAHQLSWVRLCLFRLAVAAKRARAKQTCSEE